MCQDACKRVYTCCGELQRKRRSRALHARGEREDAAEEDSTTGGYEQL